MNRASVVAVLLLTGSTSATPPGVARSRLSRIFEEVHARREQKQKHSQARERKNSQARLVSVQSSLEDSPSGFRESPGYELNPGLGRAERRQQRQRDLDKMQSRFRSGLREQKRSREQKNAPGLSLEGTGSALAQVARLGAVCDSTKTSVVIATLGVSKSGSCPLCRGKTYLSFLSSFRPTVPISDGGGCARFQLSHIQLTHLCSQKWSSSSMSAEHVASWSKGTL